MNAPLSRPPGWFERRFSPAWKPIRRDLRDCRRLQRQINRSCRHGGGFTPLSDLPIDRFRTSDTVFILGSGRSINDIRGGMAAVRAQGDIIGLNYSLLLDVVPDVHLIHEPWLPEAELATYYRLLAHRARSYERTALVYDFRQYHEAKIPLGRFPRDLAGRTFLNAPMYLPSRDETTVRGALRHFDRSGWFDEGEFGHLIHHMTTMATAVHLAVCAGYRNIVLLGVDLNNAAYFFEEKPPDLPADLMPPKKDTSAAMHSTADPNFYLRKTSLPIDRYLLALRDTIMTPRGITLHIGSRTSLLHPRLPLWPGLE